MNAGPGTNTGHGHVWERPDGLKARCGGPGACAECVADAARWAPSGVAAADEVSRLRDMLRSTRDLFRQFADDDSPTIRPAARVMAHALTVYLGERP